MNYCTDKAFILRDDDDTIIDSIDIDIDETTGLDSENRVEAAKEPMSSFAVNINRFLGRRLYWRSNVAQTM